MKQIKRNGGEIYSKKILKHLHTDKSNMKTLSLCSCWTDRHMLLSLNEKSGYNINFQLHFIASLLLQCLVTLWNPETKTNVFL